MNRMRLIGIVCLVLIGCMSAPAMARSPNIVFILADDLGYGDLGCYGQKLIQTPNIDRLAREGMKFNDFYAGNAVCAPSRCCLMTGLDMGHAPVRGNGGGTGGAKDGGKIPPDIETVAQMLKKQGYATAEIGKWGLGSVHSGSAPDDEGFDEYFGYLSQVHAHNYFPEWLMQNGKRIKLAGNETTPPKKRNGSGVALKRVTYSPDLFQQQSLKFIDEHKDQPFFLYYATTIPHPNDEDKGHGQEIPSLGQYADKPWPENERGFAAMVTLLDTQVGQILDQLKNEGIDDDTIVIFSSDNGPHSEGGHDAKFFDSAGPLRGIKRDLYEGGIREPMIVRWPGHVPAGKETDFIGYFGDFFATAAELSGGKTPNDLQSISFVPTLLGKSDQKQHEYLYWEFYERKSAQAVRFGHWKAVRIPMLTGKIELYDLDHDIGEKDDVASEDPDVVARAEQFMKDARTTNPNWRAPSELKNAKKKGDSGQDE